MQLQPQTPNTPLSI